jgi:hypothetical protein
MAMAEVAAAGLRHDTSQADGIFFFFIVFLIIQIFILG